MEQQEDFLPPSLTERDCSHLMKCWHFCRLHSMKGKSDSFYQKQYNILIILFDFVGFLSVLYRSTWSMSWDLHLQETNSFPSFFPLNLGRLWILCIGPLCTLTFPSAPASLQQPVNAGLTSSSNLVLKMWFEFPNWMPLVLFFLGKMKIAN